MGTEQNPRAFLHREFAGYGGQQSVRFGDWKAVRSNVNLKGQRARTEKAPELELCNLAQDPREQDDVTAQNPAILAKAAGLIHSHHVKSELFPLGAVDR